MAAKRTCAPPTANVGNACNTSGAEGPSRVGPVGNFTLTYLRSTADTDGHDPAVPYRNRFRHRNALHPDGPGASRSARAGGGAESGPAGAEPGGDHCCEWRCGVDISGLLRGLRDLASLASTTRVGWHGRAYLLQGLW